MAEHCYAECHISAFNAECPYAEVVILSVVAPITICIQ